MVVNEIHGNVLINAHAQCDVQHTHKQNYI